VTDLELAGMWITVLVAGVVGCALAHAAGLASTYVRDLLHVGAGVWVLGWSAWDGVAVPVALATSITAGVALAPTVAARWRPAARFTRSVSGPDESWTGLVLYGVSYTWLTAFGLAVDPFPAGVALLALSLGDGVGGAVGRRFGRHRYRVGDAKTKSLEGSIAVAVAAAAGILVAAQVFAAPLSPVAVLLLAAIAALVEAFSPRSTDNLLVPAAVFVAVTALR
jgi:phytol kinase